MENKQKLYHKYLTYICEEFDFIKGNEHELQYEKNGNKIIINLDKENFPNRWFSEDIKSEHKRVWDLKKEENIITLILVLKLLEKGYSKNNIILEKSLPIGHGGYHVDISLEKDKKIYYLIEIKTPQAIDKYTKDYTEKKIKQLISYLHQNKSIKIGFYYTFHFGNKKDDFHSIEVTDELKKTDSPEEFFNIWNKVYEDVNPLNYPPFGINAKEGKKFINLKEITEKDADNLYNEFLKILRLNSVSDKSNAFDKLINLFIAKIYDERNGKDWNFLIEADEKSPIKYKGLQFQFLENDIDNKDTFMLRLYNLYKSGMKNYLKKEISDHSEEEVKKVFSSQNATSKLQKKILKIINDLRLRKSNAFAFIEVFDIKTFDYNFEIVKKVVDLLSKYKFQYSKRSSYLGDFFEDLLNTSLKQEFGQFFTPYPLVDFMINALPLEEKLKENIQINELPRFIDYACGSGHFLISYMESLQDEIDNFKLNDLMNKEIEQSLEGWKKYKYSWAKDCVFGIEKDYRLAKTTKISLFLTGDGRAEILHADALNKFTCDDYGNSILYSKKNKNEVFDFVVSNPPFSVEGYMQNLKNMKIEFDNDFELIKKFNDKDTMIEIVFLERSWQLLKNDGFAFLILPHNFLSVRRYSEARKWMLKNFQILSIFCSGESSFWGTTTSPAIFFMKKTSLPNLKELNYQCLVINSPKALADYQKVEGKEEEKFLGYGFSKSRKKKGISEIDGGKNLTKKYSPLIKKMCLKNLNNEEKELDKEEEKLDKYSRFVILKDIILNDYKETKVGDKTVKEGNIYAFYPRYIKKIKKENQFCLKEVCEINKHSKEKMLKETINSLEYVEISKLNEEEIIGEFDEKKSWRLAKKGDLLFPKLAASNWKKQIRVANKDFKVSSAIYTLTFDNEKLRNHVSDYLKRNKNNILKDIKSLSDGFKISKIEITEFNLMNNILFVKEEEKNVQNNKN